MDNIGWTMVFYLSAEGNGDIKTKFTVQYTNRENLEFISCRTSNRKFER